MAIQLIDTATPQVGLKGGAEKINANFTDSENAASRLVQSSPTDATDGRLMAVGAFGLGAGTPQLGLFDLNNAGLGTTISVNGTDDDAASYNWPVLGAGSTPVWWVVETFGVGGRKIQRASFAFVIGGYESTVFIRVGHDEAWSDWQPIYTGANYQPETSLYGLNVVRLMRNVSGGVVLDGGTVSGTLLKVMYFDSTGQGQQSGATALGTWKNVSGRSTSNLEYGYFVRIS